MTAGLVFTGHLAAQVTQEERERLERFRRAWETYGGRAAKPLKVEAGKPDDNVQLNKARVIVDKGVSFLFGKDIGFEVEGAQDADPAGGVQDAEQSPAEEYLDSVWAANRKMTLLQKLAMNGGVCGHVFLKLRAGGAFAPDGEERPRLILLDPAMVSAQWDDEDIERVTRYVLTWTALRPVPGSPGQQRPLIRRQVVEPGPAGLAGQPAYWLIVDQEGNPDGVTWRDLGTTRWPWPFAPIVDCQNLPKPNEFWGESDLECDVLDLIGSRDRIVSNLARLLRLHGHPRMWGRGMNAKTLDMGPDQVMLLQGDTAQLGAVEMVTEVGPHLDLDRRIDEALHEIARIPAAATGKLESVGQLSALALQILYGPLLEKTETKRLTYGDLLTEVNRRLLVLGGFDAEAAAPVRIQWFDLLPSDPKAEVDTLIGKKQLGLSNATALESLGHDPAREAKASQGEQEQLAEMTDRAMNRQTLPPGRA